MIIAALLLVLCGPAAAQPAPEEVLARAARGRVDFLRAVSEVARFAPRLPSKEKLYPYILMLDALEAAGRRHDVASLAVDPVKDLGAALTHEAAKWLRLDADAPGYLDAFFKYSRNDTRITAAGESALLAAASVRPEELLAWSKGTAAALARLRSARADAPALQAFGDLQGVVTRELIARRETLPRQRLLEAVDAIETAQGLAELFAFIDLETEAASAPADRRRLLDLELRAARAAAKLGPAAPLRLRADAGALVASTLERSLFEGDELPDTLCRDAVAGLTPLQAEGLLASLADLSEGVKGPSPGRLPALRSLSVAISARFPHLAEAQRRHFERIAVKLAGK